MSYCTLSVKNLKKKRATEVKKSNSTNKIKTCQGRNRMIGLNIPQNVFEF